MVLHHVQVVVARSSETCSGFCAGGAVAEESSVIPCLGSCCCSGSPGTGKQATPRSREKRRQARRRDFRAVDWGRSCRVQRTSALASRRGQHGGNHHTSKGLSPSSSLFLGVSLSLFHTNCVAWRSTSLRALLSFARGSQRCRQEGAPTDRFSFIFVKLKASIPCNSSVLFAALDSNEAAAVS